MIRTLVLDDIPEQVSEIISLVESDPRFELAGYFEHPEKAISSLHAENIDLIFSDVEMPGLNGFEFLRSVSKKPEVIFISAYPEYAIQSFEFEPLHFLKKPLQKEDVLQAMERAYLRIKEKKKDIQPFIFVKTGSSDYQKIMLKDIIFIEGTSEEMKIVTQAGIVHTNKRLREMESDLNPSKFLRVQKSYIINLDYLNKIKSKELQMISGHSVPVGRSYRDLLKKKVGLV